MTDCVYPTQEPNQNRSLEFRTSVRHVENLRSSSTEVRFTSWARPRWRRWTGTCRPRPGRGFRSAAGRRRRRGTGPRPRPRRNTGSTASHLRDAVTEQSLGFLSSFRRPPSPAGILSLPSRKVSDAGESAVWRRVRWWRTSQTWVTFSPTVNYLWLSLLWQPSSRLILVH